MRLAGSALYVLAELSDTNGDKVWKVYASSREIDLGIYPDGMVEHDGHAGNWTVVDLKKDWRRVFAFE
jgi:hypothetical protein